MCYKSTVKDAISKWNKNNPDRKKKTMLSFSRQIGCDVSLLYFRKRSFQKHCNVIFLSNNPSVIESNFVSYYKLGIKDFVLLKKIMKKLNCELTDLIKKE